MNLNTFFQLCLYICIVMIVFTLAVNFINGLNAFESRVETGVPVGTNTSNTFVNFAGITMNEIWVGVLFGTGLLSLALAWMMHSAIPVGVWIFSSVFWTSYQSALTAITGIGIEGTQIIPADFLLIGTVMMGFFWMGAIAGMFSGSG